MEKQPQARVKKRPLIRRAKKLGIRKVRRLDQPLPRRALLTRIRPQLNQRRQEKPRQLVSLVFE